MINSSEGAAPEGALNAGANGSSATMLMIIGSALGTASFAQWAQLIGQLPIGQNGAGLFWLAALVATLLGTSRRVWAYSTRRLPAQDIWIVGYGSLLVLLGCFALFAVKTGSVAAMTLFPAAVFALYGGLWAVAEKDKAGRLVVAGSWLAAACLAWLANNPTQYLVYAFAFALLFVVPAIVLRKGLATPPARKQTVG